MNDRLTGLEIIVLKYKAFAVCHLDFKEQLFSLATSKYQMIADTYLTVLLLMCDSC
jgi:hypothetical protein